MWRKILFYNESMSKQDNVENEEVFEEKSDVWVCDGMWTGIKGERFKKYKAYYCGLCHVLKEEYGFIGQMTLTYDMTFAIILLSSLYESDTRADMHCCKVHPVKKQIMLTNEITSYGAAMNVLMAYYHMEDDWQDERKVSSLTVKRCFEVK